MMVIFWIMMFLIFKENKIYNKIFVCVVNNFCEEMEKGVSDVK